MDNGKYMFILSGSPGSGKSTLANKLMDASSKHIRRISDVCEADEFFYIRGKGRYAFDPKLLWMAHDWCQNEAKDNAECGDNFIVSNTNIKPRDRKFYFDLARKCGYGVVFIHLDTQFKSIHDVPDDVVKRMRDSYVPPTSNELEVILKWDDMSDDVKALLDDVGVEYEF